MPDRQKGGGGRPKTPTQPQAVATMVSPPPYYATAQPYDLATATKVAYHSNPKSDGRKGGGGGGDESSSSSGGAKYQDVWAAVVFVLHVAVIAWLAFGPGLKAIRKTEADADKLKSQGGGAAVDKATAELVYGGIAVLLAAGALWSQIIINVLVRMKAFIIEASLAFSVGTCVVGAVLAAIFGIWPLVIIALISALIQCMWWWCVRSRIPFASANLNVATTAVQAHAPMPVLLALGLTVLNVAWVLLWALAATGVALQKPAEQVVVLDTGVYKPSQCTTAGETCACAGLPAVDGTCDSWTVSEAQVSGYALFLLLLSLQWGALVIKEVLFCSIAGAVGDWWFNGATSGGAVGRSLSRATTTSFGSLCVGSLILSILKTLRQMVRSVNRDEEGGGCLACIAECILQCIENLMAYFNRYCMVYIALYGGSFTESGHKVFELFNKRGFTAVINDDLVESALSLVSLVVGVVTAVVGVVYAKAVGLDDSYMVALGFIGFMVGLVVGTIVLSVVDAAVATVFVCWAEDPSALQHRDAALFQKLYGAWQRVGYDLESGGFAQPPPR